MTSLVFVIGIIIGPHFVSYQCEGAITLVNGSDVRYAVPGENVTIEWSLGTSPSNAQFRVWTFITTKAETIARIVDDEKEKILTSSLAGVKIEKPATLILDNVTESYNGTYSFSLSTSTSLPQTSLVSLFIAETATVTILCSSPTIVDEDSNVKCLCKAEGGNPPASVTWYDKDNKQIGAAGNKEKMLILSNVNGSYNGTHKCVAQSYILKVEKSIEVKVRSNFVPEVTSLTSAPKEAVLSEPVIIICTVSGRPSPTYVIIFNRSVIYNGTMNTYTIQNAKRIDAGLYKCIAKNKLGTSQPKYYNLTFRAPFQKTTMATSRTTESPIIRNSATASFQKTTIAASGTTNNPNIKNSATEKAACSNSDSGTEWYIIVASLVSGFIVGILFSLILGYSRRRLRKRKPDSNPEPQTSKANTIYQDLDLSKINSDDNYQSLKATGTNDAYYENQNDSTYTELNKVRDVENSYQSLS